MSINRKTDIVNKINGGGRKEVEARSAKRVAVAVAPSSEHDETSAL